MLGAVQEFFPESGILDDEGGVTPGVLHRQSSSHSRDPQRPIPLQRVQTGISSIVGSDNGDRPGGFVLVIDGTALSYVSPRRFICESFPHRTRCSYLGSGR